MSATHCQSIQKKVDIQTRERARELQKILWNGNILEIHVKSPWEFLGILQLAISLISQNKKYWKNESQVIPKICFLSIILYEVYETNCAL